MIRHRFLPDQRLCLVRYAGEMDAEAFIAADEQVFEAAQGPDIRILFDLRDVKIVGGSRTARRYAEWLDGLDLARTHPGLLQALLVDRPVETGIAMLMVTATQNSSSFEIFSTLEAACDFLSVPIEIVQAHRDIVPV